MAREGLLFLERAAYRRRRLADAARVLPVIALMATLLPAWLAPGAFSFAAGAVWVFGLWAVLVVATAALHAALYRADPEPEPDQAEPGADIAGEPGPADAP